jgi:hypothetical protein
MLISRFSWAAIEEGQHVFVSSFFVTMKIFGNLGDVCFSLLLGRSMSR